MNCDITCPLCNCGELSESVVVGLECGNCGEIFEKDDAGGFRVIKYDEWKRSAEALLQRKVL